MAVHQSSYIFILFFHDPFGILSGGMLACPYINERERAYRFNSHWHSSALTMIQSDQRDEGRFVALCVSPVSMNECVFVCMCSGVCSVCVLA